MKERRIRLGQLGNHPAVEMAVQELARYLNRMDEGLAIDFMQAEAPAALGIPVIWVGLCEEGKSLVPKVRDSELDDAIAVEIKENSGFITGSNPRSVLIAVYRFLKELGCTWVRPGKDGERIPKKEIDCVTVSLREAASRRHRGVCIEGSDSYEHVRDMIDFLPKVGMNAYFVQFLTPFVFFERWYGRRGPQSGGNPYLEKEEITRQQVDMMTLSLEKEIARRGICYHKVGHGWTCEPFGVEGMDWYPDKVYEIPQETMDILAEMNGERKLFRNVPLNTNLCYSNPRVRETMTQFICDYCADHPQVDVVHFWLADGSNNHCECDACREKRPADWFVDLLNLLDEKMTAAGVKTRVVFLVYLDNLWAPEKGRIKNPDRFILMFAPITRSFGENYGDCVADNVALPPYTRNTLKLPSSLTENIAHLQVWQKNFAGDSFSFDYHLMWAHMADWGYEKCARHLFKDMQDLPKIGLNGMVSCQVQRCSFPTGLPLYMMAAALWNEKADFDEKADGYYLAAYGEDGAKVRGILSQISSLLNLYDAPSRAWKLDPDFPGCKDNEKMEEAKAALACLLKAHIPDGQTDREWELLGHYLRYLGHVHQLLKHWEMQEPDQIKLVYDALMDDLWQHELEIQGCLDPMITKSSLDRKFGL